MLRSIGMCIACLCLFQVTTLATASAAEPSLIPWPKEVKTDAGSMAITSSTRIIAADPSLTPLAHVLAGEMYLATGIRPNVTGSSTTNAGDIVIEQLAKQETAGKAEAYTLDVTDRATIRSATYVGAAWGTVTFLQALSVDHGAVTVPKMSITDHPDLAYRGFMKDVARQYVPIAQLHSAVELCRLYKVRYLHLHLSDDHAWTFPSTAFPLLGSHNRGAHSGEAPKVYKLDDLKELVKYADERGVTIIPEIDSPGHTDALRWSMPDLFDAPSKPGGGARLGLINMTNEKVYPALNTIFGELADVFQSSPYLHIGCDEVDAGRIKSAKDYPAFIAKHDLKNPQDVFAYYVEQLVQIAKDHHKIPIAWEGAALHRVKPGDLVIMMWTGNGGEARHLTKAGFRLINAPNSAFAGPQDVHGDLARVGVPKRNFETDLFSFGSKKASVGTGNPLMIGTQVNDWESTWDYSITGARKSVPARDANAWNALQTRSYDNYTKRFPHTDALLQRLIEPVTVVNHSEDTFDQSAGIQKLRAHVFFVKPITVSLTSSLPNTTIHYTLDDSRPSKESATYQSPFTFDKTTVVRLALFDSTGLQLAPEQKLHYDKIDYAKSLTTGKPVTVSSHQGTAVASYITDGFVMKDIWRGWWSASPCPQWAIIDLQKPELVNRVIVYPYWDGHRYYQYTVDVSLDGKNWKQVVDRSKNKEAATPKGQESKFDAVEARYIRVTVLKDSANNAAHLVEVRAYGPEAK